MTTTTPDLPTADALADPGLLAYLEGPAAAFAASTDIAAIRAGIAERATTRPRGPELHAVCDLAAGGRPARLYRPSVCPLGLVVYLHGGGWSVGSIDSHDRVCRRLAATSGQAVLSLEYRLAPEHRWPASVDDTVAALRWVASRPADLGAFTGVVAVAGDSAGGTLAALACLRLRDEAPEALPALQALLYANCDLTGHQPSMAEKARGWGLDAEVATYFVAQWVPDEAQRADQGVSPLFARDLSGLPPALVVTAEHDVVRDGAEAYAARLADAGVDVTLRREPKLVHNFLLLDELSPASAAASDRIAEEIGARLGTPAV